MKKIESVRGRERKPEINDYVYTNTEKTMRTKRARNTVEHEIFFGFGVFVRFCAELGLGWPQVGGWIFYAPGFKTLGGWGFWLESVLSFLLSERDTLSSLREQTHPWRMPLFSRLFSRLFSPFS